MHTKLLIALLTATFFVGTATGCDDKKDDDKEEKDDKKKKKKKKKDDEDEDEDEKSEKDEGDGDDSDMPKECKDYLDALDKCMDNDAVADAAKESLEAGKTAFENAAKASKGNKAAMDALKTTCESSMKAVKQACK